MGVSKSTKLMFDVKLLARRKFGHAPASTSWMCAEGDALAHGRDKSEAPATDTVANDYTLVYSSIERTVQIRSVGFGIPL